MPTAFPAVMFASIGVRLFQFSVSVARSGLMYCAACALDNLKGFNGELAVHFSGWEGVDRHPVFGCLATHLNTPVLIRILSQSHSS
jgi:hypothetical protein